jgi:hypothetical protein
VIRLAENKTFNGTVSGTLAESGGSYRISVENHLWTGAEATVTSTGSFAGVDRTLKVTLEPDTEGFGGMSLGGKLYTYDKAYVNGISSAHNPLYRPGHAHSEYGSDGQDAFVGGDFDGDGDVARLKATGDLSATGRFASSLHPVARNVDDGVSKPQYRLDKDSMLAGPFTSNSVPSNGQVIDKTRLPEGNVTFTNKVTIEKGATLHVRGDAQFLKGVEGEGNLVVDGDIVMQTDAEFDPGNNEGLKVLSDGSIAMTHPDASTSEDGIVYEIDAVGDFFAQMPPDAPAQISQGIPVTAPQDGEFFLWVDDKLTGGGDPEFNLWYEGDGTELYPGLSPTTKLWLEQSRLIKGDIQAWADS